MRLLFIYLFLLPSVGWTQEKPLAKAVSNAKASGKVDSFSNLFTANGSTKAVTNALDATQFIHQLTLNPTVLESISSQKHQLLEISLPTAEGSLELELVPATIFAPGFKMVTAVPDPNFTLDITKFQYYNGIIKNNPNSIAMVGISENSIVGTISDQTGNRVLAKRNEKSATEYAFYNENAVTTQKPTFACGTINSGPARTPLKENPTKDTLTHTTNSTTCVKYVGVYVELDYALYQLYSGNTNELTTKTLFLFDQVITLFRNDGIYVQLSQLYIWNSPDPYSGATIPSSTTNTSELLDKFRIHWNGNNDNFLGQVAFVLTSRTFSDAGGRAYLGGLTIRPYAYGMCAYISPNTVQPYPTYTYQVGALTHELGHSLGSQHTHWCGWEVSPGVLGAIDNCAPTEALEGQSPCPPGPPPVGGGTIMSYCDIIPGNSKDFTKGFGPLPRNKILSVIASANLPTTTSDGIVESIVTGNWSSASTWACGLTPTVMRNITVSGGHTVDLNTSGDTKEVNINGDLNLSISSSSLNVNN
ncbi:hypothetical protein IC229_14550 [Spirosoma sp. BT702]|uniref:Peptidase M12B domain-containing protein n=1 Tax=Spirosoma profusum TaxID=2771354 RepID=A0A926Y0V4_9BACT|nr:M12 family metallo-peptidase [Spirosoma profusum]MBD2701867.1 hypothetical protein [Spirosoma profusum]